MSANPSLILMKIESKKIESIIQLFLKAFKLIVMIISQSIFDSNENYFLLTLNKKFLMYVELMILLTVMFLALCARLHDLSIEHILNLD